ncbi:MAG: 3-ketoacyl-ACP reductase [Sphingobacterium sp.]|nr:3-ketoacyl-ACP reductase [Sphingobacterium sp.]
MPFSFEDKTVLITGASKGIGLGIAQAFAKQGAQVAIIGRQENPLVIDEINKNGGDTKFFSGDVTNHKSLKVAVSSVADYFGKIDIVCSNAGIFPTTLIENISDEEWESVMNTNVRGTFFLVKTCLPYLKKSSNGRVIITSSITGPITGYKGFSHYGASKAAQLGFMRSAALELAQDNITINAVMPGNILTEGLKDLGEDYLTRMAESIPLKRLGTPNDIAQAILFLASEGANFITGQTIVVDGGQTLPENLDGF